MSIFTPVGALANASTVLIERTCEIAVTDDHSALNLIARGLGLCHKGLDVAEQGLDNVIAEMNAEHSSLLLQTA
jgi:hypothetical protein